VIVYVPNAQPDPLSMGPVTCDRCGASISGQPIAIALTDYKGQFKLDNVPVGSNIPVVMQIGRWRKQITINTVTKCTSAPIPATSTNMPRTKAEGDIPRIALSTGNADAFECL